MSHTALLARLEDRRIYCTQLLHFTLKYVLRAISEGEFARAEAPEGWLREAEEVSALHNAELLELGHVLAALEPQQAAEIKQSAETQYIRLLRVRRQLARVYQLLSEYPTFHSAAEVRRRLDWVLGLADFSGELDWRETPLSDHLDLTVWHKDVGELHRDLLTHLAASLEVVALHDFNMQVYERAASGPIRGREIAFDLNKTLVGTYLGHIMQEQLRDYANVYNGATFDYFAHQWGLLRVPFRGMEAMLLGLCAAGNTLSLYTSDRAEPTSLHDFFNDFPLMKIPFGLASVDNLHAAVALHDLDSAPRIMYEEKREAFGQRHFAGSDGEQFLSELRQEIGVSDLSFMQSSKIPFPDFPFDVLVDDSFYWAGEMQTLGFGRRWVEATGTVESILDGLGEYFSKPLPETSARMRAWLELKSEAGAEVITLEQAHRTRIAGKLNANKGYLEGVGVDPDLLRRATVPAGTLNDQARVICDACVKQYSIDNYRFDAAHPVLSVFVELIRNCDALKEEVKSLLASVEEEHVYNFLKVPLSPYFWLK